MDRFNEKASVVNNDRRLDEDVCI